MSELTTLFQNTADAIRSKTGDTAAMQASQFPDKIQGINVGISQDEADARYLQLSGGTMSGALTLSGDPTTNLQAATKQYVDNAAGAEKLIFNGWTSGTPVAVTGDFLSSDAEMFSFRCLRYVFTRSTRTPISVANISSIGANSGISAYFPQNTGGTVEVLVNVAHSLKSYNGEVELFADVYNNATKAYVSGTLYKNMGFPMSVVNGFDSIKIYGIK